MRKASPPAGPLFDREHMRKRAADARAMAEELNNLQHQAALIRIAEYYERLAKKTEAPANTMPSER